MSSLGPSGVLPATTLPPVTTGMVVVFAIVVGAFVLFASETVRVDVTALAVMVTLMLLEPWTQITPAEGVSGFSNEATIVILAMFILAAGSAGRTSSSSSACGCCPSPAPTSSDSCW